MIRLKELQELINESLRGALPPENMARLNRDIERLDAQWEEINLQHLDGGACAVVNCLDCWLEDQLNHGAEIRLYRKGSRSGKTGLRSTE